MPRRRSEQHSDWTRRYSQDEFDADETHPVERFSKRSKFDQQMRMRRTADKRAANQELSADADSLPIGEVIQVFSLFIEVISEGKRYLCVGRRTQQRVTGVPAVVGDLVRLRPSGITNEAGQPEASIEQVLPRQTVLTRQNSFQKELAAPIVANAQQMLVVASILQPRVKWGLIDRMIIAAQSGGLEPIICVNKMDLAADHPELREEVESSLKHYGSIGVRGISASSLSGQGTAELHKMLENRKTVLAGHSGVGKSSLIRGVCPTLDIRIGDVSHFNDKGRHTTSSARRYELPFGGQVIDTPGIRHFGLVNVTAETLIGFFPDVEAQTAPDWRRESYERILASL